MKKFLLKVCGVLALSIMATSAHAQPNWLKVSLEAVKESATTPAIVVKETPFSDISVSDGETDSTGITLDTKQINSDECQVNLTISTSHIKSAKKINVSLTVRRGSETQIIRRNYYDTVAQTDRQLTLTLSGVSNGNSNGTPAVGFENSVPIK